MVVVIVVVIAAIVIVIVGRFGGPDLVVEDLGQLGLGLEARDAAQPVQRKRSHPQPSDTTTAGTSDILSGHEGPVRAMAAPAVGDESAAAVASVARAPAAWTAADKVAMS